MFIDTHAHINDESFSMDVDDVIQECLDNKVERLIVVGFNKKTNALAIELAHRYAFIYATVGLHPEEVNEYTSENMALIEEQIKDPKVIGIGECGLDYYWVKDNKDLQKEVFNEQIKWSLKYHKPLIVHMRDAKEDTYQMLKQYDNLKGIMHGYSGSLEMTKGFFDLGFYLGIGGVLTFKNAVVLKEVVANTSLKHLVLETDCPYLTPVPYRGKRNKPSYIPLIAEEIARIKGIDIKEVEDITTRNVYNLFGGDFK